VADPSPGRLAHVERTYPNVPTTYDHNDVLRSNDVEGVVIATPVSTHFRLAREALLAGKDVLVEKPLTDNAAEARELCLLADRLGRVLMVGHTFMYHPAVEYMKRLVASGALGTIFYADAARLNLGLFQRDTDVIWDLAPHDLSILLYVLGDEPESIRARGISHVGARGQLDVAFLDLMFPGSMIGNIRVSWLDPCKVRRVTIVGSQKMAVFNDVSGEEKVRVYDRGVTIPHQTDDFSDFHLSYRYGDVTIPHIAAVEPLKVECEHFVQCIAERTTPRSDGWSAYQVVQLLEAAHQSLALDGASVSCAAPPRGAHGGPLADPDPVPALNVPTVVVPLDNDAPDAVALD
ncbi:MAG: Gfo/Idh/MocA family oxidoreductase, partial [Actinomycetota bacterium]|nr:Gfo/Idh/MocA family oxidoreductase [Actinomycetota bacterium]